MPLRSFRFDLSGYLPYYGHIRLPRQLADLPVPLGYPTFMRYLWHTRNKILLRAVPLVSPFVEYNYFFLLIQRGNRFQQLWEIDHCHRCNEAWLLQLMCRLIASFNVLVSTYIIATASTRTANLIDCNFHTIRYLIIDKRTPRGAPENRKVFSAVLCVILCGSLRFLNSDSLKWIHSL